MASGESKVLFPEVVRELPWTPSFPLPFIMLDKDHPVVCLTHQTSPAPPLGPLQLLAWIKPEKIQTLPARTSLTGLHSMCFFVGWVFFSSNVPTSKMPSLMALSVSTPLSQRLFYFLPQHHSPSEIIFVDLFSCSLPVFPARKLIP